jgi:hypothetical protein
MRSKIGKVPSAFALRVSKAKTMNVFIFCFFMVNKVCASIAQVAVVFICAQICRNEHNYLIINSIKISKGLRNEDFFALGAGGPRFESWYPDTVIRRLE